MAAASEVERSLREIFKRCVQCPTDVPSCPTCPKGQICSLTPQSCDACAHAACIPNPQPAPSSGGPNVGAIAGGVIGGVVFMAVVMVLLWRFWIKKRREQQEQEAEEWAEDDIAQQKAGHFSHMRTDGASTRTRGSLANSILSRASNIIQIAYIPGVTNRNGSSHNSLAPVPPVPAAYSDHPPKSPLSNESDALFFRPDSTWSASSLQSDDLRHSLSPSLARSSLASEIYRDDANVNPMPAMPVARAIPRMVSVKPSQQTSPSTGSATSGSSSGPVKFIIPGQSGSSATSPSSRPAGSFGRATKVTVGKGRFPVRNAAEEAGPSLQHAPTVSSPLAGSSESGARDESGRMKEQNLLNTPSGTGPNTSPLSQPPESPFFDASEAQPSSTSPTSPRPNPYGAMSSTVGTKPNDKPRQSTRSVGGLSAVIEEASRRSSAAPSHEAKSDVSPFSDDHATN